jgi:hypothetical protein
VIGVRHAPSANQPHAACTAEQVATNISPSTRPITASTIGSDEGWPGIMRWRCGYIPVPGGGDIGGGDIAAADGCVSGLPVPVMGLNIGPAGA